ncbi:MAG: cytochrome c biogenesis protein ResB [Calothrix sp. SM1_5_4]|nr:cytochrome c biogenesis protein ResB [Calothrix sp. SM1_5_4]
MSLFDRIIKHLASLRLAVIVIVGLGVVSAVGTIVEARYNDAEVANRLVYQSPYMYLVMGLLIINLIAVMIDRWPWKQRHTGFVLAHVGIITLLFGAWLTQKYGIDGTMAFEVGEERRQVTVKERDFLVFGSLGGEGMKPLFESPVDFLTRPPSSQRPFRVALGQDELEILEHHQFAFRESEILPTDLKADPPAIRFQLENPNVNMTEWLRRDRSRQQSELDLGPAKVVLTDRVLEPSGRNEIILIAGPGAGGDKLDFVIYNKDKSLRLKGRVAQSETIETGWMGLKFRLLRYLPHSSEVIRYVKASRSTPMTTSAVRFRLRDKEYWAGLNAPLKLYLEDRAYLVVYGNRQIELSFPLKLLDFRIGKYEGTQRAASYESQVDVPGEGSVLISMNEPLKKDGFTFYQSSFAQNEKGESTISVLSVNFDPGRWVKYLGSMLIVIGSIVLFYFKRVQWIKKGNRG